MFRTLAAMLALMFAAAAGAAPLKIATVYAPPNHIDGRVHATKADADADAEDEEFGHRVA